MGAAELRYHRGGTDFVGTGAEADIALPANVRRYYNASVTMAAAKAASAPCAREAARRLLRSAGQSQSHRLRQSCGVRGAGGLGE